MSKIPSPGDILLAREAIEAIPREDLGPPIEVPDIPDEAKPGGLSVEETQWFTAEINKKKKKLNALVLSHNYEIPGIQDVADFVGDSIYLAKVGSESDADVIVEAAVLFMPQILAVLKKP